MTTGKPYHCRGLREEGMQCPQQQHHLVDAEVISQRTHSTPSYAVGLLSPRVFRKHKAHFEFAFLE